MNELLTSMRLWGLTALVCCALYPLIVLGFAQGVVPEKAQGSLLKRADGTLVGSRLVAQSFASPGYFWPRPSAVNYDAGAAGGSNLSPRNPQLTQRAKEMISRLDMAPGAQVTPDLVTASGSGLDPHITVLAAKLQVPRVADSRGISGETLLALIDHHHDSPILKYFGVEPLINVLALNRALDEMAKTQSNGR